MTDGDGETPPFLQSYLPYLLQRADQLMSRRFHRDLHGAGIVVSEWRVLAVLLDAGECQLSVLAARTMLPQPTTTHAVARLESAGHVARRTGAPDRRQRIVELTADGRTLAERLVAIARRRERDVLDPLTTTDVDRLRRQVLTLIASLAATP